MNLPNKQLVPFLRLYSEEVVDDPRDHDYYFNESGYVHRDDCHECQIDHAHEYFSLCCGAVYGGEISQHGFCPRCHDHAAFDCECGATKQV